MNDTNLYRALLTAIFLFAACRENTTSIHPVAPDGNLADRPGAPSVEPGDFIEVTGSLHDTGALTILESYLWGEEGISREVFFLEPRRPELSGSLVRVRNAVVVETGVYGYGVRLTGGADELDPVPVPVPRLEEETAARLAALDLDALSAHPEHNAGHRPEPADFFSLAWRAVDWTGEGEGRRLLMEGSRLPLPPLDDPLLERWMQLFAETDGTGRVERVWVGVRGSFLE